MEILTFKLGPLQTNCYLVIDKITKQALIIDPADSADYLTEKINELNLNLKYIIATHGHFDHVLGSLELKLNFQAPFLISQKDKFLLAKARGSAKYWTKIDNLLDPAKPDKFLKEDEIIKLGSEEFIVIETPGHTPGSICLFHDSENPGVTPGMKRYNNERSEHKTEEKPWASAQGSLYNRKAKTLFSGDTIFKKAVGRTDLEYSSKARLASSIEKLIKLPEETIIYPGHGSPSTIKEFKIYWLKL